MNPEKCLYNTALSDQLPGLVGHSLLTMYVCIFIQILCPIKRVKTNDIYFGEKTSGSGWDLVKTLRRIIICPQQKKLIKIAFPAVEGKSFPKLCNSSG